MTLLEHLHRHPSLESYAALRNHIASLGSEIAHVLAQLGMSTDDLDAHIVPHQKKAAEIIVPNRKALMEELTHPGNILARHGLGQGQHDIIGAIGYIKRKAYDDLGADDPVTAPTENAIQMRIEGFLEHYADQTIIPAVKRNKSGLRALFFKNANIEAQWLEDLRDAMTPLPPYSAEMHERISAYVGKKTRSTKVNYRVPSPTSRPLFARLRFGRRG